MYSFAGTLQSLAITLLVAIAFLRMVAKLLGGRQARLLYHPDMPANSRSIVPDPADYGLTHEKIEIQCPDGVRLRSYFIQGQQLSSITLIHFHGNAGNIGHRIPLAQLLIERLGVNVVLAEYRGYGFSDTPESITEEGIMMDAVATLEHVRHLPYVNPHGIIAHGSSLGGAVCIDLALRHAEKLAAVIVENTFTSISDMTDVLLAQILSHQQLSQNRRGALSVVVSALLKPVVLTINWRSIDKVSQLRCPILFVSGAEDELVPKEHMVRLYTACRMPPCPPFPHARAVPRCAALCRCPTAPTPTVSVSPCRFVCEEAGIDPWGPPQRDLHTPANDGRDARLHQRPRPAGRDGARHRVGAPCTPLAGQQRAQRSIVHPHCVGAGHVHTNAQLPIRHAVGGRGGLTMPVPGMGDGFMQRTVLDVIRGACLMHPTSARSAAELCRGTKQGLECLGLAVALAPHKAARGSPPPSRSHDAIPTRRAVGGGGGSGCPG